jgi:hypothetical protein
MKELKMPAKSPKLRQLEAQNESCQEQDRAGWARRIAETELKKRQEAK